METSSAPASSLSSLERVLWRLVLALLIIGCALTIWVFLGGRLSPPQLRLLVSAWGVAVYAGMALGCTAVLQRQTSSIGARVGLVIALAGGVLFLLGVWTDLAQSIWWWKALGASFVLAGAAAHASLLLLVRLDDRFVGVRAVTRLASYTCAVTLAFMMIFERGDDLLFRLVSMTSTLALFGTLAMPVLARLSKRS